MLRVLQAKERFEKRLGAMRADASNTTTNSSATSNTSQPSAPAGSLSGWVPAQAMLTCFYSLHGGFLSEGQLLASDNIDKIRHIPCVAVQGAADLICPPGTALDLQEAWPEMRLVLVQGAGHSMYDPKITNQLVKATDEFYTAMDGSVTF
jgi:pimeloyl-ACP methyl ester carboxylesterase